MQLISINPEPVAAFRYRNVAPGNRGVITDTWPVLRGTVDRLPDGVTSLLISGDLQGHSPEPTPRLLGEWLIEAVLEQTEIDVANAGVVFAGDLFADPHKRGGLGDTTPVWEAWARHARWVCGVLGNHDELPIPRGALFDNAFVLDGDLFEPGGVSFGGVGGIIGSPSKPNRRAAADYFDLIDGVLVDRPDVLILHPPPQIQKPRLRGSEEIASHLRLTMECGLVVCGHCYWPQPAAPLTNTVTVLNCEHRTLWLQAHP